MTKCLVITADVKRAQCHATTDQPVALSQKTPWIAALWLTALACCLALSNNSRADDNYTADTNLSDPLFIPDNLDFYNPLQSGDGHRRYDPNVSTMDNVALYRAADQYRSGEISASQRALNHQWMAQYHSGDGVRHGGKVLSKLFKMGFKTYWQNGEFGKKRYLPNDKGNGKLTNDLDYRVRLSGNKLKLSLNYEF